MATRNSSTGKVFGFVEGQENNPSTNKNLQKLGKAQRSSEEKMRIYQMLERNKQRGN